MMFSLGTVKHLHFRFYYTSLCNLVFQLDAKFLY